MSSEPEPEPPKVRVADEEPTKARVGEEELTIFQKARAAPITFGLAAINVAVMIWASRDGRDTTSLGTLLQFGADEPLHVWTGEYWRLVTSMFMHVGWIHLLWNTYASIGWCTSIERVLGKRRFLVLYLLSGIGASCVSILGSMIFGPKVSAGASGAMFGIIGATFALRGRQLPSVKAFFADRAVRSVLVQIAIWTAIGLTALHMDNSAHLGGLVTGFLFTWVLTSPPAARRNLYLAFAAAFGGIFLVAIRPWWTPADKDANDLVAYANAYLYGSVSTPDGARTWPHDVARGEHFLDKGCKHGVASACEALAEHIERMGAPDAAERSKALKRRAGELDPGLDQQIR